MVKISEQAVFRSYFGDRTISYELLYNRTIRNVPYESTRMPYGDNYGHLPDLDTLYESMVSVQPEGILYK